MLGVLKTDTDVLFYNVFGIAEVSNDRIKVSANIVRAGRPQVRTITKELEKPLKNFSAPFVISFGAWLDQDEVHAAYASLEQHDNETFRSNVKVIEDVVKSTVALFKDVLD